MLVACVALAASLGGINYAAGLLPKNSVGATQLQKKAVTGAELRKNAVTGAKVKNGSLMGLYKTSVAARHAESFGTWAVTAP